MATPSDRRRLAGQLAVLVPTNKRRLLGGAAILAASSVAAAHYVKQQQNKQSRRDIPRSDAAKPGDRKRGGGGKALKQLLPVLLRVAGRKVIVLILLAMARTALSNRLARLQGYLFRAAFLQRVPLFMRNLVENVALCAVAAGIESTMKSCIAYMELQWRRLLTNQLQSRYFGDMTYYQLSFVDRRVDVPEQRLCEDIPKLCGGLSELTQELIVAIVDAAFYGYQLQRYSGTNKYTGAIVGYVLGVGTFMTVAAPNFGKLFKRQQQLEGSYRQLHTRLRANAEAVAFYDGAAKEGLNITSNFRELIKHHVKVLSKQWKFSMVQDLLLKYLGATVAVALIIGPFFAGHMRPENNIMGRAQMLSNMRYHTSVIISLFSALGTMGASSRKFMKLGAYADRIVEMDRIMTEIKAGKGSLAQGDGEVVLDKDAISFENAVVVTPGDAVLVRDLNLRVPQGTNLLVTGPNGAGKSSLFRVLGGLWPLTKGKIGKPGADEAGGLSHDIFYVPQRPYVSVGTLQEQLIYPLAVDGASKIPEDNLRSLLKSVDLQYLLDRPGGGEEVVDWEEVLSLGEQQRLGMARLFYHKPRFAILDECTSGVTVSMEERFCQMVKEMGCTCVTISHRPALMAFHDVVLALDGEGGWSIHAGLRNGPTDEGLELNGDQKRRGEDSEAVLRGMTTAQSFTEVKSVGKILAHSPAHSEVRFSAWNPRLLLTPGHKTALLRWQSILSVLFGTNMRQSIGGVSAVAGVVVLRTLLQDRIANLNGKSVDLVLRQDLRGFTRLIGVSVLQSCASAILAPSLRHIADLLAVDWRAKLTKAISAKYLSGKTYCTTIELGGLRDADQRITRDIERLANDLASLIPTMVKPVVDVLWFSFQLYRLTGRRGMGILYIYMLIGYGSLRAVTPDFSTMLKQEYFLEGAFRSAHSRLRSHAESVAFFGGGEREGSVISHVFDDLTRHLSKLIHLRWAYGAADEFFAKQLPHNVTWLLTLLFSLEQKGDFSDTIFQGALVHKIRYLASVVTQNFSAFGELLALRKRFVEISGGITRVSELLDTVEKAAQYKPVAAKSDDIRLRQADIATPGGKVLINQLTLDVKRGKSLLVHGPQGCGKTSIFRVLAGLWDVSSGTVMRPINGIFYVTQTSYMTSGTLIDNVLYPLSIAQAIKLFGIDRKVLEERIMELMVSVRLAYLVEREGFAADKDWVTVLSLGEQQRLSFARAYFHRPKYLIVDEGTSAISVEMEKELYRLAVSHDITLITASQRAASVFLEFHQVELRVDEECWELRSISTV